MSGERLSVVPGELVHVTLPDPHTRCAGDVHRVTGKKERVRVVAAAHLADVLPGEESTFKVVEQVLEDGQKINEWVQDER